MLHAVYKVSMPSAVKYPYVDVRGCCCLDGLWFVVDRLWGKREAGLSAL